MNRKVSSAIEPREKDVALSHFPLLAIIKVNEGVLGFVVIKKKTKKYIF